MVMEFQTCLEKDQFSTSNSHEYWYNYDNSPVAADIRSLSHSDIFGWDLPNERENNSDSALLPELSDTSSESVSKIADSPPTNDMNKLLNELHDYINIDPVSAYPIDENFIPPLYDNTDALVQPGLGNTGDVFSIPAHDSFDITKFLTDEDANPQNDSKPTINHFEPRKLRAGQKKIDLKAQKYIVDGDDEDEKKTKEEPLKMDDMPVLEAGDLFSLLEQFEATVMPDLPLTFMEDSAYTKTNPEPCFIKEEPSDASKLIEDGVFKSDVVKIEKLDKEVIVDVEDIKPEPIFSRKEIKNEPMEQEIAAFCPKIKGPPHHPIKIKTETLPAQTVLKSTTANDNQQKKSSPLQETAPQNCLNTPVLFPHTYASPVEQPPQVQVRKVLNELPQDLITRLKESRKRKTIAVIPPIPSKKRGGPKMQENSGQNIPNTTNKLESTESSTSKADNAAAVHNIELDHNYCLPNSVEKNAASSDDERSIIMKQPMVKNADGKLMVSLLKVNTIRSNQQKKKLDIEEYKKRREGKIKLLKSQGSSASSSACSSPAPEDENTRILKHQEKLMRMAMEVLNTRPKSEVRPKVQRPQIRIIESRVPPDIEKKTFVSIGVNTEFKIYKNMDPVMPVQQLEEIKPLLEKSSDKFNCNSLINCMIENIPKVINKSIKVEVSEAMCPSTHQGEDKTICYLPKNRVRTKTETVAVQTNISLIQQTKEERYRRRRDSSSSGSSAASRHSVRSSHYGSRRRKNSNSSCNSSRSSYYTSRSCSRSRSKSPPPRYTSHSSYERVREVEERRVVYVGRISRYTTKEDLRRRFCRFGPITNISLHFRDHGYLDNYGFVTFRNQYDAFAAIEHGNDDPYFPKYDLSFGGRRQFCITSYSDLDNMRDETTYYPIVQPKEESFESLLRDTQERFRRRQF